MTEVEAAKSQLMPSLEKLFSGSEDSKKRLMPSIMKHFSKSHRMDLRKSEGAKAGEIAQKHLGDLEDGMQAQAGGLKEAGADGRHDAISHIEYAHGKKIIDYAEKEVGVPIRLQNPKELKRAHAGSPTKKELEMAADFPLPEHVANRLSSPVASIPIMGEEFSIADKDEEEQMPLKALEYYKWAYAIAITPGITASDLKKEKLRLIDEAKKLINIAFKNAMARAKEEGIENLSGLKPGMKKITTLPLEVLDHRVSTIPKTKTKSSQMARLLLSDGKTSIPLYVEPGRAEGIKTGDLIGLRNAYVDFVVFDKSRGEGAPGELCFMLSDKGQMTITK
jgi:hypothetical protein